jgi:putative spermidine/putrescine transport system substrate-binding protein
LAPMRAVAGITIGLVLMVAALGGCGGDGGEDDGGGQVLGELGEPEGSLNLISLPGYVEDGSRDPNFDWVTPFERRTGCTVAHRTAKSPTEVVRLIRTGKFDGVSARGDVSRRLVAEGYVDPINTELIPNYADLFEELRENGPQSVDGVSYGVPQGRKANLLAWRPALIKPDPDEFLSSELIFDPELASRYPGRVTLIDSPMSIADAALYLREHEPELDIENVYELDQEQFDAAVELLRQQRPFIGRFWSDPLENARAFADGVSITGIAWLDTVNKVSRGGVRVDAVAPGEGSSGLADVWMLSSEARHPNCTYRWMNWMIGSEANAAVARRTAQAPANELACNLVPIHCDVYHAADEDLFEEVEYWAAPLRDCGDDRGDACKTYDEWARAFAELKGGR